MIDYKYEFIEILPDIYDYLDLFETTGWNNEYGFNKLDLHNALIKSWYALSIYDSKKLIGFGRVIADGVHHALIVDLIIHPDYQKRGLGTSLLDKLIQKCLESRIRDIQLFAAKGKSGFYNKFGFESRPTDAPGMQYKLKK